MYVISLSSMLFSPMNWFSTKKKSDEPASHRLNIHATKFHFHQLFIYINCIDWTVYFSVVFFNLSNFWKYFSKTLGFLNVYAMCVFVWNTLFFFEDLVFPNIAMVLIDYPALRIDRSVCAETSTCEAFDGTFSKESLAKILSSDICSFNIHIQLFVLHFKSSVRNEEWSTLFAWKRLSHHFTSNAITGKRNIFLSSFALSFKYMQTVNVI